MLLLALLFSLASPGQPGCRTIPDTARIESIGRFSDMQYTEEHAYGRTVDLWRAGDCIFGLLEVSEGMAGDTPTGLLTDLRSTPAGALGFTAKLTTGTTRVNGSPAWVPSRDLFVFRGRLGTAALEGELRRSDQLRPGVGPAVTHVVLQRVPEQDGLFEDARTYGGWRKAVEPILRFRGPRW